MNEMYPPAKKGRTVHKKDEAIHKNFNIVLGLV